jgi:hypothetical protein
VVAAQQAATTGLADLIVAPGGGGPGQDTRHDADQHASGDVAAVALEVGLARDGVAD